MRARLDVSAAEAAPAFWRFAAPPLPPPAPPPPIVLRAIEPITTGVDVKKSMGLSINEVRRTNGEKRSDFSNGKSRRKVTPHLWEEPLVIPFFISD
ncbi:MAG: hypothetical protein WCP60_09065 [bacterium]